ncbi:MAG: diguanylate cyclase [Defluviitaleaceae bacterium]|nr:diguanylate cyclase [Defluviitaleaceae bacterium]
MENKKNSILIVDDEPMNIVVLTHILKPDYTVHVERDGMSCMEAVYELMPDLIILDILMPTMSGFEVITALKNDAATKDIPVIFITGLNSSKDEEKGLKLGAADYISKPFSPAVVKLRVKHQLQIVNQMRIIYKISITDELTGIGNRRYFYTHLEKEWQRAMRRKDFMSFLILDIDNFKVYNDTYGHLQGDIILKEAAQVIEKSLSRVTDKAARWGGEEFAVILPHTDLDGAKYVAEKIRSAIENHTFSTDDPKSTRITVSIGINCRIPSHTSSYSLKNYVSDADKLLYRAKATGKNKICASLEE